MTDLEWLESGEPDPMEALLESLGKLTDRKLRLFACGICRRNEGLVHDHRCMPAVAIAERFAEGQADARDLVIARNLANNSLARCHRPEWEPARHARTAVYCACLDNDARRSVQGNFRVARTSAGESDASARRVEADVLREIHGYPSRPAGLESESLWLTPAVVELARGIGAGRAFERMPELGFALEAAGCRDADVIEHCRKAEGHLLGCWVVDGILGKA